MLHSPAGAASPNRATYCASGAYTVQNRTDVAGRAHAPPHRVSSIVGIHSRVFIT